MAAEAASVGRPVRCRPTNLAPAATHGRDERANDRTADGARTIESVAARRDDASDDRELADRIAGGDEAAFRSLYRRWTPRLNLFLLRAFGGDEALAEDAIQETWIVAVDRLPRFRWDSRFDTWLFGIGYNVGREARRSRGRREARERAWWDAEPRSPQTGLAIDLERAIASLADGHREVLVLYDLEGWPHREIARLLGVSTGTTKSQLHAARRKLRTRLEAAGYGTRDETGSGKDTTDGTR